MKNRIFHNSLQRIVEKTKDGIEKLLPIDQFPVREFNTNEFGYPKSDLSLLMEFSKSNVDINKFNEFASRINMLKAEPKNNKTVDELIHEWRPAWIQTVTEEQQFAEWYYNEFDKPLEKSDDSDVVDDDIVNQDSNTE